MLVLLLAALLSVSLCDDQYVDESDVHVLTDANYNDFMAHNKMVLVEFYAPWCGHCKRLLPEWAKAATMLKEAGSTVKLAKVDATVERNVAGSFSIQGYPTLMFLREGYNIPFEGERKADSIVQWVEKKSAAPSTLLSSKDEISNVANAKSGIRVIGYLPEKKSQQYSLGFGLDDLFGDISFNLVTDNKLWAGKKAGTLELYKEDEPVKTLEGPFGEKKARSWLALEAFPLVSTETQAAARFKILPKLALLSVYASAEDTTTKDILAEFAKENQGSVLVGLSTDPNAPAKVGASGRVLPTAVYTKKPKSAIWDEDSEGPMTVESLKKFAEATSKGTYQSYIKSEPLPENNDGPVKVLVGKNFEDIVFQKDKDVLVEFYAPWCGHCKSLAPIYEELGQSFQNDPSIVIAKVDATANKIPSKFQVQGFPTLILVTAETQDKKNANKQVPYSAGERTLAALSAWIQENRHSAPASGAKAEL